MNFAPILTWLQSKGVGTKGQTLFENFIPDNVAGILLRQDLGGTKRDPELPGYIRTPFWLIARAPSVSQAKALCDSAEQALETIKGQTVEGVAFRYCYPVRYPFSYAPSPAQNVELAVLYTTAHIDTTL